jgi:hypothetical protein
VEKGWAPTRAVKFARQASDVIDFSPKIGRSTFGFGIWDQTRRATSPKTQETRSKAGFKNGVPFEPIAGTIQPHDIISIPTITEQGIIAEVAPLYESGHSIPEISKMTGVPRTSVRDHLIRGDVSLRPSTHVSAPREKRNSGQVRWNSPYGFQFAKGKLIPHPQEFETLRLILARSRDGDGFEAIATKLVEAKLRPRSAKHWTRFTVRQIVRWHKANPEVFGEIESSTKPNRYDGKGKGNRRSIATSSRPSRSRGKQS